MAAPIKKLSSPVDRKLLSNGDQVTRKASGLDRFIMGADLTPYPPPDQDERLRTFLDIFVKLAGPLSPEQWGMVKEEAIRGAKGLHDLMLYQIPALAERRDKVVSVIDAVRKSAASLCRAHQLVKDLWEEDTDAALTLFQAVDEEDLDGTASEVGFSEWEHIARALEAGVTYMEASKQRVAKSGYYGRKEARKAGSSTSSQGRQRGVGRPSKSWQARAVLQVAVMLEDFDRAKEIRPKGSHFRRLVRSFVELASDSSISEDTIESVAKSYLEQLQEEGFGRLGARGGKLAKPT